MGTLTYLDYTSHVQTTIKSSLLMTRLPEQSDGAFAWEMRVGYADEPHANSGETTVLVRGGRVFRDGQVMERAVLSDGTVRRGHGTERPRMMTEPPDSDSSTYWARNSAPFRSWSVSRRTEAFFERHIYRWSR